MKLFNKNKGSGAIIHRVSSVERYTLYPGRFTTVPDEIGAMLIKKYPEILSADTESVAAKSKAEEKLAAAHAEIAALKVKLDKAHAALAALDSAKEVAAPIAESVADQAEVTPRKPGRPKKADSADVKE